VHEISRLIFDCQTPITDFSSEAGAGCRGKRESSAGKRKSAPKGVVFHMGSNPVFTPIANFEAIASLRRREHAVRVC
jgi:hypothetical protein